MRCFRAVDGTEMWFVRRIEVPALPFIGMTMAFGDEFLNVVTVHLLVDEGVVTVGLGGDAPTPVEEAPKNRAELVAYCAAYPHLAGWEALPAPPHLKLVK